MKENTKKEKKNISIYNIRRGPYSDRVLTLCLPRASRKDNQAKENGSPKELKCDLKHGIFDRKSLYSYVNR